MEKKPNLFNSAAAVERMMFAIDNAGELEESIVEEFKILRANNSDAVDRALYRLGALDMFMEVAHKDVEAAKQKLEKLKRAKESFENYLLSVVKSVSFPLKGTAGELTAVKGSGRVSVDFPLTDSKTVTNIVPPNATLTVPEKYLEQVTYWRLRKDDLRKDLVKGEKVEFAQLVKEEKLEWKKSMKALL